MKLIRIGLLSILLGCLTSTLFAQVQKSDHNLGFSLDMNAVGGESSESRTNIYVSYTYFLSNRVSLGFGPRFGISKDSEDNKTTISGYNVFLNYSFLTNGGFVLPYLGVQYSKVGQKQEDSEKFTTTSIGGNFGLKFFVTERLNIDNNFSLTRMIAGSDTLDDLGIDVDGTIIQLNIGLGYIIGRKN
ncbi:MAG: outer membrane beta-barrel protein [Fulvivirga sp.]